MTPDETVFRLALSDLPDPVLTRLWDTGIREPGLVRAAQRNDDEVDDLVTYHLAGVRTVDDYDTHHRHGITAAAALALHRLGYRTPIEQRRWRRTHRIGRGNQAVLFRAGVIDPDHVAHIEAVTGVDTFARYITLRFDADAALTLAEAGISPDLAHRFVNADVANPTDMVALAGADHQITILPGAVREWRLSGVAHPTDMRLLADRGVTPRQARLLLTSGHTVDGLIDLADTHPDDFARLLESTR